MCYIKHRVSLSLLLCCQVVISVHYQPLVLYYASVDIYLNITVIIYFRFFPIIIMQISILFLVTFQGPHIYYFVIISFFLLCAVLWLKRKLHCIKVKCIIIIINFTMTVLSNIIVFLFFPHLSHHLGSSK